jgi:hypothetical protein
MEFPTQLWREVFIVLGSASAGLIGLLFIAASLHVKEIVNNPVFHARAYNNTCYLLIILVETLLILIPQPMQFLGAELVAVNCAGLWLPLRFIYICLKDREGFLRGGGSLFLAVTFSFSFLLGIAGGAALFGHLTWGIYLVAASSIILLVRVVLAAWSILEGVGQSEKAP